MRAIRARYSPFLQTRHRIEQLARLGHSVDKVEFIIMGGTFMSLDQDYRDYFIRNLHDALSGHTSNNVAEAVAFSEQSTVKCIGITIETRPDYCLKPHLSNMLLYGCTRLEIGVQSVYEDIARDTNRGHTVRAVLESFQLAKDSGFKVVAHMMPDLPNSNMERDIEGFKVRPAVPVAGVGLADGCWCADAGVLCKSAVSCRRPEDLPDASHPWHRVVRVVEDRQVQELRSRCCKDACCCCCWWLLEFEVGLSACADHQVAGGSGCQTVGTGSPMDSCLSYSA